jgi:hypothetical protein
MLSHHRSVDRFRRRVQQLLLLRAALPIRNPISHFCHHRYFHLPPMRPRRASTRSSHHCNLERRTATRPEDSGCRLDRCLL